MTPPIPVRCPISDVASAAMRTSTTSALSDERGKGVDRRRQRLCQLSGGREVDSAGSLPFAALHLQSVEPENSEAKADAEGLMGCTSERVTRCIFHGGQRRRGSAGSDSGTTTLGDRCDCS